MCSSQSIGPASLFSLDLSACIQASPGTVEDRAALRSCAVTALQQVRVLVSSFVAVVCTCNNLRMRALLLRDSSCCSMPSPVATWTLRAFLFLALLLGTLKGAQVLDGFCRHTLSAVELHAPLLALATAG